MPCLVQGHFCTRVLCLAAAAVVVSMGCVPVVKLSELTAEDQAKFKGTEPGWHALSPCFAVEIKSNSRATFYHYRDPQNTKTRETIGGEYMFWPGDFQHFGPRENAYAVSRDGRSLLYFREPVVSTIRSLIREHPNEFPAELHLYRHGLGDSLIVAGVTHFRSGPRVTTDAVIYAVPNREGLVGEPVVRSIGEFIPH